MMLQSSLMMGGRSDGFDRYRDWRLDVDNMSYEELLELGDRIGHVNTGLKEDEIVHCLRKTKLLDNLWSQFSEIEWKCSICQVHSSVIFNAVLYSQFPFSKAWFIFLYLSYFIKGTHWCVPYHTLVFFFFLGGGGCPLSKIPLTSVNCDM
ncbi:hypothetical protein CsSME_00006512 [Camellia sinensis var. sinensis]